MFYFCQGYNLEDERGHMGILFKEKAAILHKWLNTDDYLIGYKGIIEVPIVSYYAPIGATTENRVLPATWTYGRLLLLKEELGQGATSAIPRYERTITMEITSSPEFRFKGFKETDQQPVLDMKHGRSGLAKDEVNVTVVWLDSPFSFPMAFSKPAVTGGESPEIVASVLSAPAKRSPEKGTSRAGTWKTTQPTKPPHRNARRGTVSTSPKSTSKKRKISPKSGKKGGSAAKKHNTEPYKQTTIAKSPQGDMSLSPPPKPPVMSFGRETSPIILDSPDASDVSLAGNSGASDLSVIEVTPEPVSKKPEQPEKEKPAVTKETPAGVEPEAEKKGKGKGKATKKLDLQTQDTPPANRDPSPVTVKYHTKILPAQKTTGTKPLSARSVTPVVRPILFPEQGASGYTMTEEDKAAVQKRINRVAKKYVKEGVLHDPVARANLMGIKHQRPKLIKQKGVTFPSSRTFHKEETDTEPIQVVDISDTSSSPEEITEEQKKIESSHSELTPAKEDQLPSETKKDQLPSESDEIQPPPMTDTNPGGDQHSVSLMQDPAILEVGTVTKDPGTASTSSGSSQSSQHGVSPPSSSSDEPIREALRAALMETDTPDVPDNVKAQIGQRGIDQLYTEFRRVSHSEEDAGRMVSRFMANLAGNPGSLTNKMLAGIMSDDSDADDSGTDPNRSTMQPDQLYHTPSVPEAPFGRSSYRLPPPTPTTSHGDYNLAMQTPIYPADFPIITSVTTLADAIDQLIQSGHGQPSYQHTFAAPAPVFSENIPQAAPVYTRSDGLAVTTETKQEPLSQSSQDDEPDREDTEGGDGTQGGQGATQH